VSQSSQNIHKWGKLPHDLSPEQDEYSVIPRTARPVDQYPWEANSQRADLIQFGKAVHDLLQQPILGEKPDSFGVEQHSGEHRTPQLDPFMIWLIIHVSAVTGMRWTADSSPLDTGKSIVERMEKGEQSPNEFGRFDSFIQSLWVQQRAFQELHNDIVVPLGVFPV
jgi:hypothetical protein